MTKSNQTLIVVIVLVLLAAFGYWYVNKQGGTAPQPQGATPTAESGLGRAVLSIQDAATSLSGVTAINMTVDKVDVQSSTQAWTTVSTTAKVYDLVQLKNSGLAILLADVNLAAGTYHQIRLHVSKVEVTANGTTTVAKLPSNTLKIAGTFTVTAGQVSTASLDFIADKSLHLTGSGKYILAPVVHLQTKTDADVQINANHSVEVKSGKTETDTNVGMDEKGQVKADFELNANAKIEVDNEDRIRLNGVIVTPVQQGSESDTGAMNEKNPSTTPPASSESKPASVTLNFVAQSGSGLSGTAVLTEVDGKTRVDLNVSGGVLALLSPSEPAHIHSGSCANLGGIKYPLNNVVSGHSTTVVDASMDELKAELPLAINIHKSVAAIGTYIACADLKF